MTDRRRILVTGAGGFIGSHLVASQIAKGREVTAFDLSLARLAELAATAPVQLVEGDVTDAQTVREALRAADTVFHLAATHLGATASWEEYQRVNVDAVRGLAHECLRAGIRRLVHCSSVGVFGRLTSLPADEQTACVPEFAYERSKLEGERVLASAHREHGLPVTVIRPAWVYGPGCPRTLKLFQAIRKGHFVVAGKGESLRHGLYIRDMLEAFELAAHCDEAVGKVTIVADGQAVTVRSLVNEIAEITGARPPRSVPYFLFAGAAGAAELAFRTIGREPPISRRTLRFFSGNAAFDTGRARSLLGFRPEYSLSAGLRETFDVMEAGFFSSIQLAEPARLPN